MSEKPRYNATYSEIIEWFPQYTQLILFDRKTCKTLRLKVPAKFNRNATEFFQGLISGSTILNSIIRKIQKRTTISIPN